MATVADPVNLAEAEREWRQAVPDSWGVIELNDETSQRVLAEYDQRGEALAVLRELASYFESAEQAVANGGPTPPWDGMRFRNLRRRVPAAAGPSSPPPADGLVEAALTEALSRIVDLLEMADDVTPAEIVAEVRQRVTQARGETREEWAILSRETDDTEGIEMCEDEHTAHRQLALHYGDRRRFRYARVVRRDQPVAPEAPWVEVSPSTTLAQAESEEPDRG